MFINKLRQLIDTKDKEELQYYCWPLLVKLRDFQKMAEEMEANKKSPLWADKLAKAVHEEYFILQEMRPQVEKILEKTLDNSNSYVKIERDKHPPDA